MNSQVKGTLILDLVKQVRATPEKNWADYFHADDWKHLNSEIMASSWYPGSFFYRLCQAVFEVIGEKKLDIAYAYGRLTTHNLAAVYRKLIVPGDPEVSINNILRFRTSFFDDTFADARKNHVEQGPGWIKFYYYLDPDIRRQPVVSPLAASVAGSFQEAAEMGGAVSTRADFSDKNDHVEILVEWKM